MNSLATVLAEEVREKYGEVKRIGVEMDSCLLTVQRYHQLLSLLPGFDCADFSRAQSIGSYSGRNPASRRRGCSMRGEIPQVRGYSSRIMWPTISVQPAGDAARAVERLVDIQDEQIAAMAPGRVASEIDAIARKQLVWERLSVDCRHHPRYTIGFDRRTRVAADKSVSDGLAALGVAIGETILITRRRST